MTIVPWSGCTQDITDHIHGVKRPNGRRAMSRLCSVYNTCKEQMALYSFDGRSELGALCIGAGHRPGIAANIYPADRRSATK